MEVCLQPAHASFVHRLSRQLVSCRLSWLIACQPRTTSCGCLLLLVHSLSLTMHQHAYQSCVGGMQDSIARPPQHTGPAIWGDAEEDLA